MHIKAEHFAFLDELRELGITNMYGAAPYIAREFDVGLEDASNILFAWMETFSDDAPEERIKKLEETGWKS